MIYLTYLSCVHIEVQAILATLHLLQHQIHLARLGSLPRATLHIGPIVRLDRCLKAQISHRGLGKGNTLKAEVVVAIDRTPSDSLHLAIDRICDNLIVAAQTLLFCLELDIAIKIRE